jgi:H+/Cl- antiporter ClcA
METCRLDIPVARRDFTATRAAPLRDYAGLAVLFNTTVAAFLFLAETLRLLETIVTRYRILSD